MSDQRLAAIASIYPFESHYFDVGGAQMHYLDEGRGEPIVLLHGNPTWSFYYRELVLGLRDRHRVIVPDHVGCGLSDKPGRYPYTLSTHIGNLERLLAHLGVEGVTLGVHDWGGPIGLGWAVRHPKLVARLVIFNTAAFLQGSMPHLIEICGWPFLGAALVRGLNAFARGALFMCSARRERMTPDVRRGYLLPYNSYRNRVAVHRFVRDIPYDDSVPSFKTTQAIEKGLSQFRDRPMMICWGMKDFCFTPKFLDEWWSRFPNATIHRFDDAGHYVVEDAWERILPLLLSFTEDHKPR